MLDEYFINSKTYFLMPIDEKTTKVIEEDHNFTINENIMEIIEKSCEFYGSSYEGRLKGSQTILGMRYKLPVIIEERHGIVFFPTLSTKNNDCVWISYTNLKEFNTNKDKVIIQFNNDSKETFNISEETLETQVYRSYKLLKIQQKRIEGK